MCVTKGAGIMCSPLGGTDTFLKALYSPYCNPVKLTVVSPAGSLRVMLRVIE